MALPRRQTTNDSDTFDDQGPALWGSFVGNWTRYPANHSIFNNGTLTATPNIRDSLSFNFSGT